MVSKYSLVFLLFGALIAVSNALPYQHGDERLVTANSVTYRLYTRENPDKYIKLKIGALSDVALDAAKPFKYIIHGYIDNADKQWVLDIKNAFLERDDCNVITVDWRWVAINPLYPVAAKDTNKVGQHLSKLILDLESTLGASADNVHLIGHSLGAHISGFAGQHYLAAAGKLIGQITGMDPAGPWFTNVKPEERLSPDDAQFVEAIHTDGMKWGLLEEVAHVDFYANKGIAPQPGCITYEIGDVTSCSHLNSYRYFTESVNTVEFVGRQCDNASDYNAGLCEENPSAVFGPNIDTSARGKFYLNTNAKQPYAKNGKI